MVFHLPPRQLDVIFCHNMAMEPAEMNVAHLPGELAAPGISDVFTGGVWAGGVLTLGMLKSSLSEPRQFH